MARPRPALLALTVPLLLPGRGLATTAAELCAPAAAVCVVDRSRAVDPGSILDFGARPVTLRRGVSLDVGSGALKVLAGTLTAGNANKEKAALRATERALKRRERLRARAQRRGRIGPSVAEAMARGAAGVGDALVVIRAELAR